MPKAMLSAIKSCGDCWLCDRTAQWICFRLSTLDIVASDSSDSV